MNDTKTKAPTIAQIMMQAQRFASAWSIVGSLADYEGALADAEHERGKLRVLVTAALATQSAQQVASVPTRDEIRAIFLANGFTLKDNDDLRPYVYDAAYALIQRVLETPPISAAQHPDDLAVDRFAAAMKEKMALARAKGRGGWNDPAQCSVERLATMLVEHIAKGDPVDVANFAMMLHQRGAGLEVLAQQSLQQEQDRIDAERYRWLRDNRDSDWKICEWDGDEYVCDGRAPEIVDACIDVARKGGSNG